MAKPKERMGVMMNNKVEELRERVRLTEKDLPWLYNFTVTRGNIDSVLDYQLNKVLNDPDLALIDRDFLWKIKAMLRGVQIKQQSDSNITWETSLDVALKEFDDSIIPLAEALKELK